METKSQDNMPSQTADIIAEQAGAEYESPATVLQNQSQSMERTPEQLREIVKNAEEYVPIPIDDVDKIKEHWKAAQSYDFEKEISEDDLPDEIKNDPDKLAAWRDENKKTERSRKILREKFNSMTDDDFRKWAEEANSNYHSIVGIAKIEVEKIAQSLGRKSNADEVLTPSRVGRHRKEEASGRTHQVLEDNRPEAQAGEPHRQGAGGIPRISEGMPQYSLAHEF